MEIDEPRSPVNEVFGYRRITWKVRNFLAGRYNNDWVRSPVFCVYSPFLTKWEIAIKLSPAGKNMIAIYLKRVKDGTQWRLVRANYKFIFPRDENNEVKFEKDSIFKTTEVMGTKIHAFSDYEFNLLKKNFTFTVKCHIMVYRSDDWNVLEYYGGGSLKLLSQDLALLGYLKKETDTTLYYHSTDAIQVHRAVLCCRNQVFNSVIKGCSIANLNFPYEYVKGLEKVILFLYSGNLKYVLRAPSFAIEKAIEDFKVEELKEYFTYDELSLETRFVVDEVQFKWTVPNLDRIKKGCIVSHRMRGLQNEIFRLVLYPRGVSGNEDYMSLRVQLVKGVQPRIFCVYAGVYDIYNEIRGIKCCPWPPYVLGSLILNNIIIASRDILNNVFFQTRGEIKFFCKFQMFVDVAHNPVNERYPVINKVNIFKHMEKLSRDMNSLYTEGKNGDLLVFTPNPNVIYRVHKMILCCRSYKFSRLVRNRKKIRLINVDPEVIDVTFHYLYTGVLKETEPGTAVKAYKFADNLRIQGLKPLCADFLEANLNFENATRILITAHNYKDQILKSACLNFICSNFNAVSDQEQWQGFINNFPDLYLQVIKFVCMSDNDEIEFEDNEKEESEIEEFLGKLTLSF